jgi:hypothetical protein
MSLTTVKFLQNAGDSSAQVNGESGWHEISRGLTHVVWGYTVLIGGSLLGAGIIWLALDGRLATVWAGATEDDRQSALAMGVLTLGLTAFLSYGLVLAGQWRCLMYSPERQHAKELMYLCINCVFIASGLNVVGVVLDGNHSYSALQQGWEGVEAIDWCSAGNVAQLGSAAMGLFASLVFSQFLRNVASCFNDRARVRSVDLNLALVGLLLGGSAGTLLWVHRLTSKAEMLPWLVGGWLLCFAWHLWLVHSVRCGVAAALRWGPALIVRPAPLGAPAGITLNSLSGLRRLANRANR